MMEEEFEEIEVVIDEDFDDLLAVANHAMGDLDMAHSLEAARAEPSLWDQAADYFIDKIVPEVGDMMAQKWNEGANEIAKALYGQADGFVLYGHSTMKAVEQPDFDAMLYESSLRAMPEQENQLER
jgi:hypothetical protein